jgi:hypothetical protein
MDEAYISSHRNQVSNIIQMTFATQNCWGVAYLHTKRTYAGVWRDATRSMTGYNIRQEKEKRESQTGKRKNDSIN